MSLRRLIAEIDTSSLNVTQFCAEHGVSTWSFYSIRRRFSVEGEAALELGSRAPHRVPNRTSVVVEDQIVSLRKELDDAGLDAGAATIQWHLSNRGIEPPSVSTIYRVLVRRGFVVPDPKKKPKASKSFNAGRANQVWQIDGTNWTMADGTVVKIINIIDDCSRVCIASQVHDAETLTGAWDTVTTGFMAWGLPERFLSDNGSAFKSLRHQMTQIGIGFGHSRPYHPQTCGKVERFHPTLKKWLTKQTPATTKPDLQHQLDQFVHIYNHERPHRGINRQIPAAVWHHTPKAGPANTPLADRPTVIKRGTVDKKSVVYGAGKAISLPKGNAGLPYTLIATDTRAHVFINGQLTRKLELDPNKRDHTIHKRPGRPTTNA